MTERILMKGNEALAESAIIAGCRHYFGYPTTPQNEIPAYMAERMPEIGGEFVQAESEIAAINMVMGASAAGARAMTSSSSPGIALKQEAITYMAGQELPCLIVNMMRGGPGLGNISGSQADYNQATRGGGNGDYHVIVLAPSTVQEIADLTIMAFDLADNYRNPVMILGDGYLGQMSEPLNLPKPSEKEFDKPWALTGAKGRPNQKIASLRLAPDNALYEHNLHLAEKYKKIEDELQLFERYRTEDAEAVIVAYGTSARVAIEACDALRDMGVKAGVFRPVSLWPFPFKALKETAGDKRVLVVEMSLGQMVDDVRLALYRDVEFYGMPGGIVPTVSDIIKRMKP